MIDLDQIKNFVLQRAVPSALHGPDHWNRVARIGEHLAGITGANLTVIRVFALLHDSMRVNDAADPDHGLRAAKLIESLRDSLLKDLSETEFQQLMFACENHTHLHKSDNITVNTCFDSDRLDLQRCGISPDPCRMATEAGSILAIRPDYLNKIPEVMKNARIISELKQILLNDNPGIQLCERNDLLKELRGQYGNSLLEFVEFGNLQSTLSMFLTQIGKITDSHFVIYYLHRPSESTEIVFVNNELIIYDQSLCTVYDNRLHFINESYKDFINYIMQIPENIDSHYLYRGISGKEFYNIRRTGVIQSNKYLKGTTYFGQCEPVAAWYANPEIRPYMGPTFYTNSYVIQIPRDRVQFAVKDKWEGSVSGPVPIQSINSIKEIRPAYQSIGRIEVFPRNNKLHVQTVSFRNCISMPVSSIKVVYFRPSISRAVIREFAPDEVAAFKENNVCASGL